MIPPTPCKPSGVVLPETPKSSPFSFRALPLPSRKEAVSVKPVTLVACTPSSPEFLSHKRVIETLLVFVNKIPAPVVF